MIDLSEIVVDPDLADNYTIYRTSGDFALGGWQPTPSQPILLATVNADNPGEHYHILDVLTIAGGAGGTAKVTGVDGTGVIQTLELLTAGTGYTTELAVSVSVSPSGGSGAKVDIMAGPENPLPIPAFGVVSVASGEDLLMVPEGDRVTGTMAFYCPQQIYLSDGEGTLLADRIEYNGQTYKVMVSKPWGAFGYWKAIAIRESGA